MNDFWDYTFWDNSARDWSIALGIILASIIALRLVQYFVIWRLKALSQRTQTTVDDFIIRVIQKTVMPLLYILAFYAGIQYLVLPTKAQNILHIAVLVVITFFFLRILTSIVGYIFHRALMRHGKSAERERQSKGILLIVQVSLWLIGILFLIDNLGYDITTLIAGLGIGGIAIALAAQTILADLFSYLVIFFDKPFEIGDFIVVDDKMGTVDYVGVKTTRIKSLTGEQLVCSNKDLTNSRLHNYKRMLERRVVLSFGVVYSTSANTLKAIPSMVREIIESEDKTRFDRAHFKGFGNSSLDFEAVYFVLSQDYNIYMDVQERINIRLFELFEQEGIEFAYPTQTLYMQPVKQSLLNQE